MILLTSLEQSPQKESRRGCADQLEFWLPAQIKTLKKSVIEIDRDVNSTIANPTQSK